MKKYIIPTKHEMMEWRFLFEGPLRVEEDLQAPIVKDLVEMAKWLILGKIKNDQLLSLHEEVHSLVVDLVNTGSLPQRNKDLAVTMGYDFCRRLAKYLVEINVIGKDSPVVEFEGFLGLNIIIKVLGDREIDETDERVCLSG